ncbi:MAG: hypothetical protein B6I37_07445 [Desulfobacteraceae bacterium 4572_35.2]|jgi:fumarate reductase subunit C|nr:MAG: hypothetical protein B6I37_07445 [Desulfobacteraceae bacterium 4572_35.2]
MKKRHDNPPINPHKSISVLRQPYTTRRFKHFTENLVAIVLVLITVTSLSFAAANFFGKSNPLALTQEASSLVPAIYFKNEDHDSVTL